MYQSPILLALCGGTDSPHKGPVLRKAFISHGVIRFNSKALKICIPHYSGQRHNERDGVTNHRRLDCLLHRLFRHRSKKISKFRFTGLSDGNPSVTVGFASQRASNAENVSIWRRHHVISTTAAGDIEKVEDVELQWQDASSVDYTHFYRDEPRPSKYDDQCVTLDTEHGMWITEECSLSRGFVCRVNKGTVKCGNRITLLQVSSL